MKVEFDIASDQIDGARDYQEDAYMVNQLGDAENGERCSLIVMADGMGGHAAGNVASNMVVATFNKTFQGKFPSADVGELLTDALNRSNDQIRASVKETPALRGMGCTMVTAFLQGNKLYWVSVGDSHLYLIRDRELIKQNADHSYGAYIDMMKEQGMDIDEQAGMSRNMLMSAMTGEEISSIDVSDTPVELKPGDRVIVASDGLDTLGIGAIIQYSSWSGSAKECVYALLKAVDDANKINQDNTTLIVADVKEREPNFDPAPARAPTSPYVAEVQIVDDFDESNSFKWVIWLLVIIVVAGGGFVAWKFGLFNEVLNRSAELVESQLKKLEPVPAPEPESEPEAEPELEFEPEFEPEPEPEPELETAPPSKPIVKNKNKVFRDRLKSGGKGPTMIKLPAGVFNMGGTSSIVAADEFPRRRVKVSSFMVSVFEITFAQYNKFARATGRRRPKTNGWNVNTHPVVDVSWQNALAYTRWLSKQTGKRYRLLSEAEWEYMARAGTTTPYWWGFKAGQGNAHCFDCESNLTVGKPTKVGSFESNPFGIYDTAGNVFEWVHDCYHRSYDNAPTDGSVWQGGDCDVRVVRGGAFRSPANSMRAENREIFPSDRGQYNVGIRVARDL